MRISDWSSDVCSSDLAQRPLAAAPAAHRQALLAVQPEHLLVVRLQALACQQDAQPPVTEPAPLAGQLAQAGTQDLAAPHTLGVLIGCPEIGRASCRGNLCPVVFVSVLGVSL